MTLDLNWQARQPHFWPWLLLLAMGWLMVASASTGIAEKLTGNAGYFAIRHGVYLLLGGAAMVLVSQVSLKKLKEMEFLLMVAAFVGLCLVLVPGIGHTVNGSSRWLNLGIIKLQPSEIAKVAAIFYVSGYLVRRHQEVRERFWGFIKPLFILMLMVVLILLEPDFGTAAVLMGAAMIQLFLGGVRAGQYFLLMAGTLGAAVMILRAESWRMERLSAFLDPWSPEHVYDKGYQLTQSLIAFGRGEWFGVGLGESIQKLLYLPEAHTDFVFAIWAEETGLIGGLVAVLLLAWMIWRIMQTVWQAQAAGELYGAQICVGIGSTLALQVMINLGVNTGLLPTKGLTLPFFSYGGSSLVIACAMMGLVMRIHYETSPDDQRGSDQPFEPAPVAGQSKANDPVGATDGMRV